MKRSGAIAAVLLLSGIACMLAPTLAPAAEPRGARFFGIWRLRHVAPAAALVWLGALVWARERRPRAARGLAISTAAFAASFVALEVAGGLGGIEWSALLAGGGKLTLGHEAVPHLDQRGLAQQDIALACGLEFERVPYHFRSDQRGFRNPVDRDAADVYLLGDSFIVAGLVPAGELVSSRLEARWGRPSMNVALSGISPQAERDLLLASDLPLDGRLVLHFVFEGNDLADSAAFRSGAASGPGRRSFLDRSLFTALVVHLQRASERALTVARCSIGLLGGERYLFGWLRPSFEGLEGECQAVADSLLELRAEVERRGADYAVVFIPAKIRVLGPLCTFPPESTIADFESHLNPLRVFLLAWSQAHQVPLLDLTDDLAASAQAGRVPYFPGDTHWNGTGHAVAADAIARWEIAARWLAQAPAELER